MTERQHKLNSKAIGGAVGGGIAFVVVVVMMFAPIVPVSYQEAYTEIQTRQESYVVVEKRQEPYTTIETRTENLLTITDTTIPGGEWAGQSVYIPRDRSIELRVSASDTLRTYVMSQSDYEANNNQYSNPISEQSSVRYGFTAPISDTYYFTFYNHHDGFFGLGAKNVGLYSSTVTATWDESVTKYRTVDVPVTKYRDVQETVTKYRDATKNITPLDLLMGKK
ncbi:MAG: hypothetical protein ACRD5H_15355 [Nitrososphaerales archaeon]